MVLPIFLFVQTLRAVGTGCVYCAFTIIGVGCQYNSMVSDRPGKYRRLAAECLTLARQTFDETARASLLAMAQTLLDLAEFHQRSAQYHVVRTAIGKELKSLYRLSDCLPPHLLALLAQLNVALKDDGAIG
jgi:hypothetical protein